MPEDKSFLEANPDRKNFGFVFSWKLPNSDRKCPLISPFSPDYFCKMRFRFKTTPKPEDAPLKI